MVKSNYISSIAELSESEGVFTTAQAARMGIPRDALHDASKGGRIERVVRGAYRLVGSGSAQTDELTAIWKLTAPSKFAHERMQPSEWDGVAIGGSTAASFLGISDFYLSPYRIYTPKRFNSRKKVASFAVRRIAREDVSFESGLPITRVERTIFDLVVDDEDLSLVSDTLRDACYAGKQFDFEKLKDLFVDQYGREKGLSIFEMLLENAGISEKERANGL